jgi:peptidoglycan/xylan/chitin deacetylase (PgdA/CDA1 family)
LTFDDGPGRGTGEILGLLDRAAARATSGGLKAVPVGDIL